MAPSQYIEASGSKAGSLLAFRRALDVQPSILPTVNVLAASSDASSSRSSLIIVLSVVLGVIGVASLVALYYIVVQRKALRDANTIQVVYNIDSLQSDASVERGEKADDVKSLDDITVETMDEKPHILHSFSQELPHVLVPTTRPRKHGPQMLTIVIPRAGAPRDIELVDGTGADSAVTVNTALPTAISSAVSTAHIVMQDKVFISNGWAPATIVYLPKHAKTPRSATGRRITLRTPRKTPRTPRERKSIVA